MKLRTHNCLGAQSYYLGDQNQVQAIDQLEATFRSSPSNSSRHRLSQSTKRPHTQQTYVEQPTYAASYHHHAPRNMRSIGSLATHVHATRGIYKQSTTTDLNDGLWTRCPQMESDNILRRNVDRQSRRPTRERRRTTPHAPDTTWTGHRHPTPRGRDFCRLGPHRS